MNSKDKEGSAGAEDDSREPTLELIRRVLDGDAEAWNEIDARYRKMLLFFLRGKIRGDLRRRFDSEALVQSAMFRAFEGLRVFEYQGRGSFKRWLIQILRNLENQRKREHLAQKRDIRRHEDLDLLVDNAAGPTSGPDEEISRLEQRGRILVALNDLTDDHYKLIVARFFDGQTLREIAADSGCAEKTVRERLARAVQELEKKMRDLPSDWDSGGNVQ